MSSRTYYMIFDMINAGEYTPASALQEAHDMHALAPKFYADAIDLLITWALGKQDQFVRLLNEAKQAEVRTARGWVSAVRYEEYRRLHQKAARRSPWDHATTGDEPF